MEGARITGARDPMTSGPLTYALDGTTAVITMDDGKANALSAAMLEDLKGAIARAEGEATAVVLAGRVGRFSAGFDLNVMMSSPEAAVALLREGAGVLLTIFRSPLPIVAACTGHALAGGALLLLVADQRVGASGAFRIGLNEVGIGLPVPILAMELARARIARTELTRATLMGEIYDPEGASRAGYLDEVVGASDAVPRALEHAARLGTLPRRAYQATKVRLRGATIERIAGSLEEDLSALLGVPR